ncbi:MAG: DUF4177 domain-containing protein [Lentisphaerae bacterium]|jgi:hypothetical protein|nr:DUF4177 domain-containing protein [Lentisphaerota bacterium]
MVWEYRTIKIDAKGWFVGGKVDEQSLDQSMNDLGRDGWELVTALDTNTEGGASRHILAIFKRHAS